MNNKLLSVLLLSAVFGFAPVGASAGRDRHYDRHSYEDWARVVDVDPIYRQVATSYPREVCADVSDRGYRSYTPAVVGGILGGVVGHQFGGGRGKDALTVAGALLGASVGRDAASAGYRSRGYRCWNERERWYHSELDGYRVRYRYAGRHYHTVLPYDPGDRLRVEVLVGTVRDVRVLDRDRHHEHRDQGHDRYNRGHDWNRR